MAFKANADIRPFTRISIVLDDLLLLAAQPWGKVLPYGRADSLQRCILRQIGKTFYVAVAETTQMYLDA